MTAPEPPWTPITHALPVAGLLVEIQGNDFMGDWRGVAFLKPYKPTAHEKQRRRARWMRHGTFGPEPLPFKDRPERWRPLTPETAKKHRVS